MNARKIANSPNHRDFLQKEAGASQFVSMRPTSHAYSAGSFLRYAGFYAGPTVDTLEEANLIRERGL